MRKLFLLFVFINPLWAYGFDLFSGMLDLYRCADSVDAMNCKKCKKFDAKEEFDKVNINFVEKKSAAVIKRYKRGDLVDILTIEPPEYKCIATDKKNWSCRVELDYRLEKTGMNDGVYYYIHKANHPSLPGSIESYVCAR